MSDIFTIHVKKLPILQQLQIEEALLRLDERNFFLINEGSPPSIVMGISAKPSDWVDLKAACKHNIPVIRRFSGGGTVAVDASTLFTSLIVNQQDIHIEPYPEHLMHWSASFYRPAFAPVSLELAGQDFAFMGRKCGGNAQYFRKKRFLQHTTFLWDYCPDFMDILRHPPTEPAYRQGRSHQEFLLKLKDYIPCRSGWIDKLKSRLACFFDHVYEIGLQDVLHILQKPHRRATCIEQRE